MKRYLALLVACGALVLIAVPAMAVIGIREKVDILLQKDKVPQGVTWSPKFKLTEVGLVSPQPKKNVSYEVWIQTQKVPAGLSWRPPKSVRLELSVKGSASAGFPLQAYVRYSCDGAHWSTWYYMPATDKAVEKSLETYECEIRLPKVAFESYRKLMREWRKTEPDWSSDEDEFCRWLTKKAPDFFAKEFPFIGYLQFRLEHGGLKQQVKIDSLSVNISWGVGGRHSLPKSGKEPDRDRKWHFDIRDVQKEASDKKE